MSVFTRQPLTTQRFIPADKSIRAYKALFEPDRPLSAEEIDMLLVQLYSTTDAKQQQQLTDMIVRQSQRLVYSIAKSRGTQYNLLDLISEGNIGLLKAIRKFQPTFGVKFVTYAALWITSAIKHYITEQEKLVTPPNAYRLSIYIKKAEKWFWVKNNRLPTLEELAGVIEDQFQFKIVDLHDLEPFQSCQIDAKMCDTACDGRSVTYNAYNDTIATEATKEKIDVLLNQLSVRERDIIEHSYGLNGHNLKTQEEIAQRWDVSRERIRQIKNRVITKFQRYEEKSCIN